MKRALEVGDLCHVKYRKHWWKVLGFGYYGVIVESQEYRNKRIVVEPFLIGVVVHHEESSNV